MDWPHAPLHRLDEAGAYIVTAGTYQKRPFFNSNERLSLLRDQLLTLALKYGWNLQAWAILSNHYHFVSTSPADPNTLSRFISHLHTATAAEINRMDGEPGRRVWFQYWDTKITFEKSYLARLAYVHYNPVKHGIVAVASQYEWCSAAWFEQTADSAFCQTVRNFKTDLVKVQDDF